MFRTCPKCHKTIRSDSALFCYHCGSVLGIMDGKNDESKIPANETGSNPKQPLACKSRFPKTALLFFFLALILAGGYFGYTKFKNQKKPSNDIISPVDLSKDQKFEIDLANLDITLSPGAFNANILSQISPVSVDFFIALNNPSSFYENFIEKDSKVDINNLTGLSVEEVASFLEPSFFIIGREKSWAFIAKTKNKEFLQTKLEEINTKDLEYEISLVGDFLIITNDVNILNEIENVEKGTSLSLSKDAFFVEAVKNLPTDGVALVFYRDINKLTPLFEKVGNKDKVDSKGKNAFVAIKSGKGVILQF